jgi:acetylglutamate kinase
MGFGADGNLIQSDKTKSPHNKLWFCRWCQSSEYTLRNVTFKQSGTVFCAITRWQRTIIKHKRRHDCLWMQSLYQKFWRCFELLFWKPGVLFDAEDDASVIENINPGICKIKAEKKPYIPNDSQTGQLF